MDRMEKLINAGKELLHARLAENCDKLVLEIEENKEEIIEQLRASLQTILDRGIVLQEKGEKGEIAFLSFSILLSNIIMKDYGFLIELYDERFYLDTKEVTSEWKPEFIFQYLDEDMKIIEKEIDKTVIRVKEYEMLEIKRTHALNYYRLATELLELMLPMALEKVELKTLATKPKIEIILGLYMEKQQPIYTWEVEA